MDTVLASQRSWERFVQTEGNSVVNRIFGGQTMARVSCENCRTLGISEGGRIDFTAFSILPLQIPRREKNVDAFHHSLLQLILNDYGNAGIVLEDYTCGNCGVKGDASQSYYITKLPDYLLIMIKRFANEQLEESTLVTKNSAFVSFPLKNLDLQSAVHPDLRSSIDAVYDCVGVANHIGETLSPGHYTADIKYEYRNNNGEWIRHDDSRRKMIKATEVVVSITHPLSITSFHHFDAVNILISLQSSNAYILLYRRRAPAAPLAEMRPVGEAKQPAAREMARASSRLRRRRASSILPPSTTRISKTRTPPARKTSYKSTKS